MIYFIFRGIPPPAFSLGISVMTASVIMNIAVTNTACYSAERVTLVGQRFLRQPCLPTRL